MPDGTTLVLNVDDRDTVRRALSRILALAGFDVVEAAAGREALACARVRRPALVLVDVDVPDLGGFELCRRLRRDPETAAIPVLLVSGHAASSAQRLQGLGCGAAGYLTHPIDPAQLVATVRALVVAGDPGEAPASGRWDATFRASGEGVALVDARGSVRRCNRAMAELLGRTFEEVRGQSLAELLVGCFGPIELPVVDEQVDAAARSVELQAGERWFRLTVDRWDGEPGLGPSVVYTLADETERRRLEAELRRQAEELLQADRQKDEFLAMLAHELRNPLAAASNALHLLDHGNAAAAREARLRAALGRQIRHLSRMVDDLLDVSRITHGRIELQRARADLTRLVRGAVRAARMAIGDGALCLELETPDAPVLVDVDVTRIEQVVMNLVSNAAKYTPSPGRIEVCVERDDEAARVRVRDSGIGIAPDRLERIFDLFVQGDVPLDRSAGGLGVGLTLVKRLVDLHGGEVRAESAGPGQGAEFVVTLPLAEAAEPLARCAAGGEPTRRAPGRVLIVEDLDDTRETLCEMVSMWGHEVVAAENGPRALTLAEAQPPDVALVDIGLPEMDGYEVARRLRARFGRDLFLVALTGYGQARDQRNAIAAGFDVHLVKPCAPRTLMALLASRPQKSEGPHTAP